MSGRVWQITAASQTGSSHLRRGEACGDSYVWRQTAHALIVAVADGAGSARLGAAGSAITTANAVRIAALSLEGQENGTAAFPVLSVRDVFARTLETLTQALTFAKNGKFNMSGSEPPDPAKEPARYPFETFRQLPPGSPACDVELRDLHTTLLLAALTRQGLTVGNIGDGWLVARRPGGECRAVAAPRPAEHANETFFLDSPGALDDAVYDCVPDDDVDCFALLSDGAARFAIDLSNGRPGAVLFQKLFAFAADKTVPQCRRDAELADFLNSDRVCSVSDDDKTMVIGVSSAD